MSELIRREDAINAATTPEKVEGYNLYPPSHGVLLERLNTIPAVDAVEVKHGRWLRSHTAWVYCSECGSEPPNETNAETPYCPWCGSRNDGDDK